MAGASAYEKKTRLIVNLEQTTEWSKDELNSLFSHPLFENERTETTEHCRQLRERVFQNITRETLRRGVAFFESNRMLFEEVEQQFNIPPEIILSILRRETVFGVCVGDFYVMQRLTSLYMHTTRSRHRAFALEQLSALLSLAHEEEWSTERLLSLPGSSMGAFGYGNFIPSSRKNYAIDGNEDGVIDLFDPRDAISSIANYLVEKGWHGDKNLYPIPYDYASYCARVVRNYSNTDHGEALFRYNNSCRYVQKIIDYARAIRPLLPRKQ
jgi:membrane-bound lytic murein transglycosylase B